MSQLSVLRVHLIPFSAHSMPGKPHILQLRTCDSGSVLTSSGIVSPRGLVNCCWCSGNVECKGSFGLEVEAGSELLCRCGPSHHTRRGFPVAKGCMGWTNKEEARALEEAVLPPQLGGGALGMQKKVPRRHGGGFCTRNMRPGWDIGGIVSLQVSENGGILGR